MAQKTIKSTSSVVFLNRTDARQLSVYISSTHPTTQIYNPETGIYTPDWSKTSLTLSAEAYIDSKEVTTDTQIEFSWFTRVGNVETAIGSGRDVIISTNVLNDTNPIITYVCKATYQKTNTALAQLTFSQTKVGTTGASAPMVMAQYSADGNTGWTAALDTAIHKYIRHSYDGGKTWTVGIKMVGTDGSSVSIKGTASSVASQSGGAYYVSFNGNQVTAANLGDGYIYGGDLYVCTSLNSNAGSPDFFTNVGSIQGPQGHDGVSSYMFIRYAEDVNGTNVSQTPTGKTTYIGIYTSNSNIEPTDVSLYTWTKFVGDNAKSIVLTGDSQVFKVSKANAITPTTIKVTAQATNTTVTTWTYSTNGGAFSATLPAGITRSGNTVTITGASMTASTVVIRASDGANSDVYTVYKALDGVDAPIAFLTNENISFSANYNGEISATTFTTNVVAYVGTTKVEPTIREISVLPTGMTRNPPVSESSEKKIQFNIAEGANLGSSSNNSGIITISLSAPVNTTLQLHWSKINAGRPGGDGIPGPAGADGVSTYFHVKYAPTATPTESQMSENPNAYIGTYVDNTEADSNDPSDYKWVKIQGQDGAQGIPGTNGTNGQTSYLHIAYANNDTGTSGFSTSDSMNKLYIGQYVDFISGDSTDPTKYLWAKIKGDKGDTGTPASLVKITPSALYFKSTTGKSGVFDPQYIYLYPVFQTVTYGSWQYSVNGGITWVSVSGANGLTVGTYNSTANSLRIDRASTLYTDTVTSISFRCNSSNSAIYDIVSIAKIYDVVDIQIGARNLIIRTNEIEKQMFGTTGELASNASTSVMNDYIAVSPSEILTFQKETSDEYFRWNWYDSNKVYIARKADATNVFQWTVPQNTYFIRVSYPNTGNVKLERGNKATDWTPAPEDLQIGINNAQNIASDAQTKIDQLQIGGTNLLKNSNREVTDAREFVRYADIAPIFDTYGIGEYTISFDIKSANITNRQTIQVYCQNGSNTRYTIGPILVPVTTEYTRRHIVVTPTLFDSNIKEAWLAFYGQYDTGNIPTIKNVKIERGNKPTDWSPTAEDLIEEASNTSVILSNESHLFEADSNGIPTPTTITLDVVGFKGATQVATMVGTITGLPSAGMGASLTDNVTTNTKINIAVNGLLTSDIADYGVLTIPITVNGKVINKKFSWSKSKAGVAGTPGTDAVTFQVHSSNGFALSTNKPVITLTTFAYVGDVEITAGAEYQWYSEKDDVWTPISGATKAYLDVSREDVSYSNNYMCKMTFEGVEYTGVVTVDDKNDDNKLFTTKPTSYTVGDLWLVGADYIPNDVEWGTLLRAENTRTTYNESDWVKATRYDEDVDDLKDKIREYDQHFSFDQDIGVTISARSDDGEQNNFSTVLSNTKLAFIEGTTEIASISGNKMHIKEAEVESPLTVTGKYSGSTMQQAPIINIGNFSIVVESNGSLSIIANT